MTQLYSNLLYYVSNTTYLCLLLVVLGTPKISRVRLASLHTASLPLPACILHSLANIPLLLISEDKGGPTHGHETKNQFCSMEAGSCKWVEEIYRAQIETLIILLQMKLGLHNIPVVFKIFPLLTCI